jgi:7-cyano-7-deazaguanine reductase
MNKKYWIPRSGPMPRPKSVEEAMEVLKKESFETPEKGIEVTFETREFTALCPITGQPDYGGIKITYKADEKCIESKSLKFYLWSYREYQGFAETVAKRIADDVEYAISPLSLTVEVMYNIRGGISLNAVVHREKSKEEI